MVRPSWPGMVPPCSQDETMTETGFVVECPLAVRWLPLTEAAAVNPHRDRGNLLLLRTLNLMAASYEGEGERVLERIETKLDLMLHWLGLSLHGEPPALLTAVRLEGHRLTWCPDPLPASGARVVLLLHPHPELAAPLALSGEVEKLESGQVTVQLDAMSEDLADQWTQWLFRLHRRAIHMARDNRKG